MPTITATHVIVTAQELTAELSDGRTDVGAARPGIPRLIHATPEERNNWRLIGSGEGIHWPDLDEDISVEMLLGGWPSGESQRSFKRWLEAKQAGLPVTIHEIRPASPCHAERSRRRSPRFSAQHPLERA